MNSVSVFSVIFLVVSLLVLIGGVLLLVFGISSTIKGKKRIGRIVAGGILIFYGLASSVISLMFVSVIGRTDTLSMATKESGTVSLVTTALKQNDAETLAEAFAKEGYSGDAPDKADAEEILKLIEGKVRNVQISTTGIKFKNENSCTTYRIVVITEEEKKYTITAYIMSASDDERYLGVQRISMKDLDGLLYEAGTTPSFN